jgi:hypothetical protein
VPRNLAAGHQFSLLHRSLNGLHRGLDIDYHALFHTPGWVGANAHHLDLSLRANLTNDRHHLGRADIKPYDHPFVLRAAHGSVSPMPLVISQSL